MSRVFPFSSLLGLDCGAYGRSEHEKFSVLLSFDYLFPNAGFLQDFIQQSFILQDFLTILHFTRLLNQLNQLVQLIAIGV